MFYQGRALPLSYGGTWVRGGATCHSRTADCNSGEFLIQLIFHSAKHSLSWRMDGRIDSGEQLGAQHWNTAGFTEIVYSQIPEMGLQDIDDPWLELSQPRNDVPVRQLEADREFEELGLATSAREIRQHGRKWVIDGLHRWWWRCFGCLRPGRCVFNPQKFLQHAGHISRRGAATEQDENQTDNYYQFLRAGLGFGFVVEFLVQGFLARAGAHNLDAFTEIGGLSLRIVECRDGKKPRRRQNPLPAELCSMEISCASPLSGTRQSRFIIRRFPSL